MNYQDSGEDFERWPEGFVRIPDESWAENPIDEAALKYESHASNSFRRSWDPTLAQVFTALDENKVLVDYSCGTGIFSELLLKEIKFPARIINVDVSPRYLRVALDKFRSNPNVALRLLKHLEVERKYQEVCDVLGDSLSKRGVDILTSTNSIHLYGDVRETLESWYRALRSNGRVLISSGDMGGNGDSELSGSVSNWNLHGTVETVNEIAQQAIATVDKFAEYRDVANDSSIMTAYAEFRRKVYPATRSVDFYLDALSQAKLRPLHCYQSALSVSEKDLVDALLPYHSVVLGWVGGTRKIGGIEPSSEDVRNRTLLIEYCVREMCKKENDIRFPWTYITAVK